MSNFMIFGYTYKLLKIMEGLFINKKRQFIYIHANYQKINSNIFTVFYLFYRTYTKIFIIFGLAHNLLYKIKHTS